MDVAVLIAWLVRGVARLSLAAAIGGLVLDGLAGRAGAVEVPIARARLRRWITVCFGVLLLASLVELVIRTQAMSRASLAAALAAVPAVVARTHFGALVAARAGAVALAMLLSVSGAPAPRALCLLLALGIAFLTTLVGHTAEWGDLTLSAAADWLHAIAASAWTGGLIGLTLVVFRFRPSWPPESLIPLARRFSRLSGACLVAVILTGSYTAWVQLDAPSRLWSTVYGQILIVKLTFVAVLVWLGACNRYLVLPRLDPQRSRSGPGARFFRLSRLVILGARPSPRSAEAGTQLAATVRREALLVVAVFACTAALGEATPGRHVSFERRPTSHVTLARPGDGAPRPGAVTPPAGNAARGRALFARHRCFTCHTVRGEGFAAPTRPGPDLSGIGRSHPGYLVESIMNPNAKIVDGPGYSNDRGLSTMPDYRERLTVADLIDLVAYLASLRGGP